MMVRWCLVAVSVGLAAGAGYGGGLPYQNDYAFGLDVSFVKQREDGGRQLRDEGGVKPGLQLFKDHGFNWGRVHLCNEPARLPQNLQYVAAAGADIKKHGMKFLLDFMFSNGWANPMTQPTPSAWREMTREQRVTAVYEFTRDTIKTLADANAMPDMVQVGNEIGNGFLWPDGRLYPERDQPASEWGNFTDYLKAGIKGVREAAGTNNIKIMLHVDHGGDIPLTKGFFDKMREYKIDYDVIGFSFYPWSHGTLMDLRDNLRFAATEYGKEIIVVETGYYFEPSRYFRSTPPPFPETPEGQRQWFETVNEIVMATPNGLGRGVFWWEPMQRGRGFFDNEGTAQPIIHAFEKYTRPAVRTDGQKRIQ
jgi:arabinogalactan endo-1,4-beta-galactosidase